MDATEAPEALAELRRLAHSCSLTEGCLDAALPLIETQWYELTDLIESLEGCVAGCDAGVVLRLHRVLSRLYFYLDDMPMASAHALRGQYSYEAQTQYAHHVTEYILSQYSGIKRRIEAKAETEAEAETETEGEEADSPAPTDTKAEAKTEHPLLGLMPQMELVVAAGTHRVLVDMYITFRVVVFN
ncbi:hypothetical protein KIPB_002858 [Kipferlia bialata]|uniref:Uncharacterized protein n=1 Tax=Kipferlia bialata TaxID=797122 RepID=A0A391P105_9EUKA|nr:hypothetical protein KIPB_002858 [Kipferlia bialata]|eukprot:g2858.t1